MISLSQMINAIVFNHAIKPNYNPNKVTDYSLSKYAPDIFLKIRSYVEKYALCIF